MHGGALAILVTVEAVAIGLLGDVALNQQIVGMAATPTGLGYGMVAADGGIVTFADPAPAAAGPGPQPRLRGVSQFRRRPRGPRSTGPPAPPRPARRGGRWPGRRIGG